jgi:stress-induced-phosphoprotein 1
LKLQKNNIYFQLEKQAKEAKRVAYFDETKAQEAKDKGNEFFKKGQFPDAIKAYEEGLQRTADGDCVNYFD